MSRTSIAWRPLWVGALLLSSLWATPTSAYTTNGKHRLKAFDIHLYQTLTDSATGQPIPWKPDPCGIGGCPYNSSHPELSWALWDALYNNCSTSACADKSSNKWADSNTTVDNFHSALAAGADLVLFLGHHESIREWNYISETFPVWVPWSTSLKARSQYYTSYWTAVNTGAGNEPVGDWGTGKLPYFYHYKNTDYGKGSPLSGGIMDAAFGEWTSPQPAYDVCWSEDPSGVHHGVVWCFMTSTTSAKSYGVQYMYNAATSVLIGQDYTSGTWTTENDNVSTTTKSTDRKGQLGTQGVKWYIANGCNLVTVARYLTQNTDTGYMWATDKGRSQWLPSWKGAHMALGHYDSVYSYCLPNMYNVANEMKAGMDMVESYFDNHTSTLPNCQNPTHEGLSMPAALGPDDNILWYDTWTSPMANPTSQSGAWASYYEVAE